MGMGIGLGSMQPMIATSPEPADHEEISKFAPLVVDTDGHHAAGDLQRLLG
jgi:hypothetical protein